MRKVLDGIHQQLVGNLERGNVYLYRAFAPSNAIIALFGGSETGKGGINLPSI